MSRKVPADIARAVKRRAKDRCEYCRLPQHLQEAEFHIDHVFPRCLGGASVTINLALACVTCSLKKGERIVGLDAGTGRTVRLFNPRVDSWSETFSLGLDMQIKGRTANGRATVDLLSMNQPRMVRIRQLMIRQKMW